MNHLRDGFEGVMNNTKWEELRLAMYGMETQSPKWRTKDIETGYVSRWDREWFYHFRNGGYSTIEWVEIESDDDQHMEIIRNALKAIRVPGVIQEKGFLIFGWVPTGSTIEYLD